MLNCLRNLFRKMDTPLIQKIKEIILSTNYLDWKETKGDFRTRWHYSKGRVDISYSFGIGSKDFDIHIDDNYIVLDIWDLGILCDFCLKWYREQETMNEPEYKGNRLILDYKI